MVGGEMARHFVKRNDFKHEHNILFRHMAKKGYLMVFSAILTGTFVFGVIIHTTKSVQPVGQTIDSIQSMYFETRVYIEGLFAIPQAFPNDVTPTI